MGETAEGKNSRRVFDNCVDNRLMGETAEGRVLKKGI